MHECHFIQMAQPFCVSESNASCVHCCSSHPWGNDPASVSSVFLVLVGTNMQCPSVPLSGESVERTQMDWGVGRGRWSEARKIKMLEGRNFIVNGNTHSRSVVKEDGDCVRLNLNTGWTEVNGTRPWYLGHLLIYSSIFYQDCSARGPHKEFGENKTTGIKDHCLALALVPSANIYSHCVNKE